MHKNLLSESFKGRDHFARPRRRWKNNIKMDLMEVGCKDVD